jgi:hypothetical protein
MKPKSVRSRVVTGCLLSMLLPASESLFAKSVNTPRFDFCSVERVRLGALTFGAPRELLPDPVGGSIGSAPPALVSINAMAPWFRRAVDRFQTDGICPVEAIVEAPAAARSAVAEVQPPGVVRNLRRTDQP